MTTRRRWRRGKIRIERETSTWDVSCDMGHKTRETFSIAVGPHELDVCGPCFQELAAAIAKVLEDLVAEGTR
jgi:hypothetical protein